MTNEYEENPLLAPAPLPRFSQVRPEHLKEAVDKSIAKCTEVIRKVCSEHAKDPTWDNAIAPIEEADDAFSRVWGTIAHLNNVRNTKPFREAYMQCLPAVSAYSSWAGQYRPLYEVYEKIADSDAFGRLTLAQQAAVRNSLRDFRLSGIDLDEDKKKRFAQIDERLSELSTRFANNVLDSTQDYVLEIKDEKDLAGIPEGARDAAAKAAQKRGLSGWAFTLDLASYVPFITYAENRSLREKIYKAFAVRASELCTRPSEWDNGPVIEEILKLRHEQAALLGFDNYASLSLAPKMAKDPKEVLDFLDDLAAKSIAQGRREYKELEDFARSEGAAGLEPWDISFYSEKLRRSRYSVDTEALREFFPVGQVIRGLFECAHRLYGVTFRPHMGVDVWDPQVRFYDVCDEYGSTIGSFYVDLYARDGKQGGAWMDECLTRRYRSDGTLQLPVAYVECNFRPPRQGEEAELTHDDVETLFHEFGHALNQLLTRIDIPDVSGINGVPWDAVELPSQFNENFAWQAEALRFISRSVKTGKPLGDDVIARLVSARNFESAMMMLRQLEFAIFDMRIHAQYDPKKGGRVLETLREVQRQVRVTPVYENDRFPDSFSHIFAGGYAAGYYSYKWAEVLSADAFGRFLEEGIFSREAGASFRDNILAVGGSRDEMKSFVAFRGRKPQVEALLRQSGITGK
ncbi:MAG: M3 family metallopeptidase [Succinivibrio sp.]